MVKILIIGAGWYGCHIACYFLSRKVDIELIDKEPFIFSGASSKNQNRLHLGYHYPRSPATIEECKRGYSKFIDTYKDSVRDVPNNYYMIHNGSKTSLDTYIQIFDVKVYNSNCGIPMFCVDEKFIDNKRAARNFSVILGQYFKCTPYIDISVYEDDIYANGCKYDAVINCTNNQWIPIPIPLSPTYEVFCSFVYKIDFDVPTAFTVMDGEYFSIYPYDLDKNQYTLTHVKHGVLCRSGGVNVNDTDMHAIEKRRIDTEKEVFNILPFLRGKMEYINAFLSYKTKYDFINDDRSLRTFRKGRYFSFSGGKITGIFDTEPFLDEILICSQTGVWPSSSSPENNTLSNPSILDS